LLILAVERIELLLDLRRLLLCLFGLASLKIGHSGGFTGATAEQAEREGSGEQRAEFHCGTPGVGEAAV